MKPSVVSRNVQLLLLLKSLVSQYSSSGSNSVDAGLYRGYREYSGVFDTVWKFSYVRRWRSSLISLVNRVGVGRRACEGPLLYDYRSGKRNRSRLYLFDSA